MSIFDERDIRALDAFVDNYRENQTHRFSSKQYVRLLSDRKIDEQTQTVFQNVARLGHVGSSREISILNIKLIVSAMIAGEEVIFIRNYNMIYPEVTLIRPDGTPMGTTVVGSPPLSVVPSPNLVAQAPTTKYTVMYTSGAYKGATYDYEDSFGAIIGVWKDTDNPKHDIAFMWRPANEIHVLRYNLDRQRGTINTRDPILGEAFYITEVYDNGPFKGQEKSGMQSEIKIFHREWVESSKSRIQQEIDIRRGVDQGELRFDGEHLIWRMHIVGGTANRVAGEDFNIQQSQQVSPVRYRFEGIADQLDETDTNNIYSWLHRSDAKHDVYLGVYILRYPREDKKRIRVFDIENQKEGWIVQEAPKMIDLTKDDDDPRRKVLDLTKGSDEKPSRNNPLVIRVPRRLLRDQGRPPRKDVLGRFSPHRRASRPPSPARQPVNIAWDTQGFRAMVRLVGKPSMYIALLAEFHAELLQWIRLGTQDIVIGGIRYFFPAEIRPGPNSLLMVIRGEKGFSIEIEEQFIPMLRPEVKPLPGARRSALRTRGKHSMEHLDASFAFAVETWRNQNEFRHQIYMRSGETVYVFSRGTDIITAYNMRTGERREYRMEYRGPPVNEQICAFCGEEARFKCKTYEDILYCSKECQLEHWKE